MAGDKHLQVILVHGTWSSGERWDDDRSPIRQRLHRELSPYYARTSVTNVEWSGRIRWRARDRAARDLAARLRSLREAETGDTEYLLIGHSHGGNVATEAARERMAIDDRFRLKGVVCLNTPFLQHEIRAASPYLVVWALVCLVTCLGLAYAAAWGGTVGLDAATLEHRMTGLAFTPAAFIAMLLTQLGMLGWAIHAHHGLRLKQAQQPQPWEPRPRVLCLSSADDEAITFLGLGEGLANLPQLMLHPVTVAVVGLAAVVRLLAVEEVSWCPLEPACWTVAPLAIGLVVSMWIGLAIVLGMLSSLAVLWIFGLSPLQFVKTMVTRVLVSYVPLRPANAEFRAVADYDVKWWSLQLFHSRIHSSEAAIRDLCGWVTGKALAAERLQRGVRVEAANAPSANSQDWRERPADSA